MSAKITNVFNNHFLEFVDDIQRVFPDNIDILTTKNKLIAIKSMNPKILIKLWKSIVTDQYGSQIEAGDLDFFLNKDYTTDISAVENSGKIMEAIDRLRQPIKNMTTDDKSKSIKYIQNLTKLSYMSE
jgi:hypothetical protein